jgi:hypothetical protein
VWASFDGTLLGLSGDSLIALFIWATTKANWNDFDSQTRSLKVIYDSSQGSFSQPSAAGFWDDVSNPSLYTIRYGPGNTIHSLAVLISGSSVTGSPSETKMMADGVYYSESEFAAAYPGPSSVTFPIYDSATASFKALTLAPTAITDLSVGVASLVWEDIAGADADAVGISDITMGDFTWSTQILGATMNPEGPTDPFYDGLQMNLALKLPVSWKDDGVLVNNPTEKLDIRLNPWLVEHGYLPGTQIGAYPVSYRVVGDQIYIEYGPGTKLSELMRAWELYVTQGLGTLPKANWIGSDALYAATTNGTDTSSVVISHNQGNGNDSAIFLSPQALESAQSFHSLGRMDPFLEHSDDIQVLPVVPAGNAWLHLENATVDSQGNEAGRWRTVPSAMGRFYWVLQTPSDDMPENLTVEVATLSFYCEAKADPYQGGNNPPGGYGLTISLQYDETLDENEIAPDYYEFEGLGHMEVNEQVENPPLDIVVRFGLNTKLSALAGWWYKSEIPEMSSDIAQQVVQFKAGEPGQIRFTITPRPNLMMPPRGFSSFQALAEAGEPYDFPLAQMAAGGEVITIYFDPAINDPFETIAVQWEST